MADKLGHPDMLCADQSTIKRVSGVHMATRIAAWTKYRQILLLACTRRRNIAT